MAANYLGHFYLSHLLMPQLIAGGEKSNFNSRIVNVSSCAHFVGKINYDDFNNKKYYNEGMAYADSKLAQILFTRELNRICEENNWKVQVNSCHPGIVDTGKVLMKKFWIKQLIIYFRNISKLFFGFDGDFAKNIVQGKFLKFSSAFFNILNFFRRTPSKVHDQSSSQQSIQV